MDNIQKDLEKKYLDSLNEKQLLAYDVAKTYLGESFSLVKSNGFLKFLKKTQIESQTKS